VRKIAEQAGLVNYAKKDSTGICFIGERKFKEFLKEFILAQTGNIETVNGKVIGQHDGVMFYTLGQRAGLNIGGVAGALEKPWYVLQKDIDRNILIAGQDHDDPLLYHDELICQQLHWVSGHPPTTPYQCSAKIRYRQQDQACTLITLNEKYLTVKFNQPQRAVTPGQSVVFYQKNICLGGGVIV